MSEEICAKLLTVPINWDNIFLVRKGNLKVKY